MEKKIIMNKMYREMPTNKGKVEKRGSQCTLWLKNNTETTLHGKKAGDVFRVLCDQKGNPLAKEMRRRISDGDFVAVKHAKPEKVVKAEIKEKKGEN